MTELWTLIGNAAVNCEDAACGKLAWLVVDPLAKTVTHLAVELGRTPGLGRLVPVDLVQGAGHEIRLACSLIEFEAFKPDEAAQLVSTGRGAAMLPFSQVPEGGLEFNSDEVIRATDGAVGRLRGLVIDPIDYRITHVLLEVGLIRKKDVSLPVEYIASIDTHGVNLTLSKTGVADFQ